MNKIKLLAILIIFTGLFSSKSYSQKKTPKKIEANQTQSKIQKIKVLNFGTFHMGYTPDENTTKFDERNEKNKLAVYEIARKLAEFKPTVIIVESLPKNNEELQNSYAEYLKNPNMKYENPTEIELLAFELGRLSKTTKIYGIDHKLEYNYKIGSEINNSIDPDTHDGYYKNPFRTTPEIDVDQDKLSLLDKLKLTNNDQYLDFLITANADILTHAGTKDNFEGADEAAKFYQRNLRMYSNLNRIPLQKDDRVFILMGASHTAFFRDFISRSPKYEMVDTFEYLK